MDCIDLQKVNPRGMEIFNNEKLDNLFLEKSEELKRQLSPVIDQIVLVTMRQEILPPEQHANMERKKEFKCLMDYYVNIVHQIIGYNP